MTEPNHEESTRAVYDYSTDLYLEAVGTEVSPEFEAELDRAVLAAFAGMLATNPQGHVLDVGCGPGRVARFLADRGLHASGVDIAPAMVAAARSAHPHLQFDEAPLTQLPVSDHSLAGAVYWYSIIATPPDQLAAVWQELDRVLEPGGQILVAFQSGDGEAIERPNAYGSDHTLTLYLHSVDHVGSLLDAAGFDVTANVVREPELPHETTPQAFLLANRNENAASV